MRSARVVVNTFGKAIRETGQALDRLGCNIAGEEVYKSTLSRHRQIMPVGIDYHPEVSTSNTFIAPTAAVIGRVKIAEGASVWYGAVLRADMTGNAISVGPRSNIQDRSVLLGTVAVGAGVTVGHGALIEGKVTIGDHCLIGQGSIIGDNCVVESKSILAAGAVLLPNTTVPSGQMWAGNPAKFVRACKPTETATFEPQAKHYLELAAEHAKAF
jgi:carbonic anhydrase/acetyltransferase-like protein (isoleucine patch superfamily)